MEQRRGPNIQPVHAAATDPAYVPGITSPRLAADPGEAAPSADTATGAEPRGEVVEKKDAAAADVEDTGTAEAPDDDGGDASDTSSEVPEVPEAEESGESDSPYDAGDSAEPDATEGDADDSAAAGSGDAPVFEASDRRGSITADRSGVRLRLDDQECEFRWDEIGAVEIETSRFGRWFTVTVHTPDRRWYPADIEVGNKARVKEWTDRLDAVLDAYFDDEPEPEAGEEADAHAETGDEAEAKAEAGGSRV